MKKNTKFIVEILIFAIILFIGITTVNAAVEVTRNMYSNNGSMKFEFTGLTLDTTHEYEFGFTKTAATEVAKWHLITEYTETKATVDITGATNEFADVIRATETGYITIKDKTADTIVLQPYAVDISIPYLNITNYNVISNGKEFSRSSGMIQVNFWNNTNSDAYYQYEKITDENVISKFKEIKNKNGDYNELSSLLKTQAPSSNWNTWNAWYYDGTGCTERTVNVPDEGLYYMWIYLAGNNTRNLYGYILVDNLEPEIALDSISLPKTKEVELGKTLTLTPTFNPETTTNKIVTWTSSDESVATVSNAGVVTPIKVGSTIITVTSQDGNKKATCTVTVTEASNGTSGSSNTSGNTNTVNGGNTSGTSSTGSTSTNGSSSSSTTSTSTSTTNSNSKSSNGVNKLPYTGIGITGAFAVIVVVGVAVITYRKYNYLKGIK